jgi:predicted SprT family Zn-dependent metalloprotease
MSIQCLCYVCENGMGASQRLLSSLRNRVTARNFDNAEQANTFSIELSKQLRKYGVEIDDWRKVGGTHWFGLYPKGENLKASILSALSKLGYAPWLFNKKVMTHDKFGYPLFVTDTEIVLLGQSVPRWGKIVNTLKGVTSDKPKFNDKQPLGFLSFSVSVDAANTSVSKTLKGLGFTKEKEGLLFSKEDDLEIEYSPSGGTMGLKLQQPQSELPLNEKQFETQRKIPPVERPEAPPVEKPVVKPPVVTPKPELPIAKDPPETPREPDVILTKPDQILVKKDNTQVPHIPIPIKLADFYPKCGGLGGSQGGILWMRNLWNFLNEQKFSGQLKMPNISYIKNVARMRTRGYWRAHGRELKMAPRAFNAPLPAFVEIFLHEMCHQAVSEIDKTVDRTQQGHGPHWQQWMRKVGLNPSRYDHNDSDIYLSEEEQIEVKKKREKAEENKKELSLTPEWDLRPGKVVRIALDSGSKVRTGVIAYKQTSKYAVIVEPLGGQWWNVPPQLIYKADPAEDQSQYKSEMWQRAIARVQQHFQVKKEVRQMRKTYRIGY